MKKFIVKARSRIVRGIKADLYCSCGAEWHGQYAMPDLNPIIESHKNRDWCSFITKDSFEALFGVRRGRNRK
jgi:hypothetical protein